MAPDGLNTYIIYPTSHNNLPSPDADEDYEEDLVETTAADAEELSLAAMLQNGPEDDYDYDYEEY